MRSPGKHRLYTHGEVAALRDALQEGLSISSAISHARQALSADTSILVGALQAFELERADAAMEAALALRSVERSVQHVLLPSLEEIGDRHGFQSAPWAFAARWAADWLGRAHRLAPPPMRRGAILFGDATRDDLDVDALHLRTLQLLAIRAGARVLVLPVSGLAGLNDVLDAFDPQVVVVGGAHADDDDVARWAYRVRSALGAPPFVVFRRGEGSGRLPDRHDEAVAEVLDLLDDSSRARPRSLTAAPMPRSGEQRRAS